MNYGLPWQGSKSRIAEWVVDQLPPSHTLVDLFAGGGAITHCALLSGKFGRVIANDKTDSMMVFSAAVNGDFDGYALWPSRAEWQEQKDDDTAEAVLMSFGTDRTTFLWSEELEQVKRCATLMISSASAYERHVWYRRFCKKVQEYIANGGDVSKLEQVESITRLNRIRGLERLRDSGRFDGFIGMQGDYRLVDIPDGATVYADPPYRSTANSARYGEFDFDAFDKWLGGVGFPVFVSEFDAPAGCVEVACIERVGSMSATTTDRYTERIFVQERFADKVQVGAPTLF